MVDEVLSVGLCMDNGIHYFFNTDRPDPLRIFIGRVPRHSLGFTTTRNKSLHGQWYPLFFQYRQSGSTADFRRSCPQAENPQWIRIVCIEKIMDTIVHAETHTEHFIDHLSNQNIIVQIHSE